MKQMIKCLTCEYHIHRKHCHRCKWNANKVILGQLQEQIDKPCTHFKPIEEA